MSFDKNGHLAAMDWYASDAPTRSQTDEDNDLYPVGSRRSRQRVSSFDDSSIDLSDVNRTEAMVEGHRMLVDSLREKVKTLEDKCERADRERGALGDLLSSKKRDFEDLKDHYDSAVETLEDEVQRLKSEKARLLDKLKLPESERASLVAEENEIADLKRKVEDAEARYSESMSEIEDLKQEVRDLQLEMEEVHDQFREEEAAELRELQKELEGTAKSCRILQFKLKKAERKLEQMESERAQSDEKMRNLESCFQTSDDKRRIRLLEEELRMAKEVSVQLHDELERVEERKTKFQEEAEKAKTSLQRELDSVNSEVYISQFSVAW